MIDCTPRYGGFAAAAETLTVAAAAYPGIFRAPPQGAFTRQQVYGWWRRRDVNQFPERQAVNGSTGEQLDLLEVLLWYARYVPSPGGRPSRDRRP